MSDWTAFTEAVPSFLYWKPVVEVGAPRNARALSSSAASLFPDLAELLARASVTDVTVSGAAYELLAWDSAEGERLGWLCLAPSANPPPNLFEGHRQLLASFGGIVERFNEPEDTWLLNLNDALTEREASNDASFLQHCQWAFEDAGLTLPIEPSEYYVIAQEANGNATLCHRDSGQVLMFAHDHCFDHLTELEGCPEYTLYRIKGATSFREWVNAVAVQWLGHVGRSA